MFAAYFGDDEATAAEGPYLRLLKLRKWLYLASALASVNAAGLLDPVALNKVIGNIARFDGLTLTLPIVSGLALTSLQYALLLVQGLSIYDIILDDRMASKKNDAAHEARSKRDSSLADLQQNLDGAQTKRLNQERDLIEFKEVAPRYVVEFEPPDIRDGMADVAHFADYEAALEEFSSSPRNYERVGRLSSAERREAGQYLHWLKRHDRKSYETMIFNSNIGVENISITPLSDYRKEKARLHSLVVESDQAIGQYQSAIRGVERDFLHALRRDPRERNGFMRIERVLDAVRMLPPCGAALFAWGHVAYAVWWGLQQ